MQDQPADARTRAHDKGGIRVPIGVDVALLALVAAAMAFLTWRGWADPLVDFGRELYVPWRLSEGSALYRDVAWFNGPLSPYLNALWFRLFGPGLMTLAAANAIVAVIAVTCLYRLVADFAGRWGGRLACLVFVSVFAFGQYVGIANYNWITPYSHELTHGVVLALAALAALAAWHRSGSPVLIGLAGLLLGLCFLTKVETFVAAAAGGAVLLGSGMRTRKVNALVPWFLGLVAPVVVSLALFGPRGTLGAWPSVLAGEVADLPFYREGMGLDDPRLRIEETGAWVVVWALGLLVPIAASWLARETRSARALPISAAVTLALLLLMGDRMPWTEALRPLGFFTLVAVLGLAVAELRGRPKPETGATVPDEGAGETGRSHVPVGLAFGVLSLVLLAKMLLNVRSGHYGFALAAPATAFMVGVLWRVVPDLVDRAGSRGDVVRGAVLALLATFCLAHVRTTDSWMERKTEVVGTGRDALRTDLRGAFVQLAVDHVRDAGYRSVAVLPEGVMINYLARVPNPTPYLNFMPPEEILFGDEAWEAVFRAAPPDAIVIVPRDTSEFGRGAFGSGYGHRLWEWVGSEYVPDTSLRIDGVNYELRVLVRRNFPT
jgi:hypothetical protein